MKLINECNYWLKYSITYVNINICPNEPLVKKQSYSSCFLDKNKEGEK